MSAQHKGHISYHCDSLEHFSTCCLYLNNNTTLCGIIFQKTSIEDPFTHTSHAVLGANYNLDTGVCEIYDATLDIMTAGIDDLLYTNDSNDFLLQKVCYGQFILMMSYD